MTEKAFKRAAAAIARVHRATHETRKAVATMERFPIYTLKGARRHGLLNPDLELVEGKPVEKVLASGDVKALQAAHEKLLAREKVAAE